MFHQTDNSKVRENVIDRTKNVVVGATETTAKIAKDANDAIKTNIEKGTSFSKKIMQQLPKMGKVAAAFAGLIITTFFPGLTPLTQAFTGI